MRVFIYIFATLCLLGCETAKEHANTLIDGYWDTVFGVVEGQGDELVLVEAHADGPGALQVGEPYAKDLRSKGGLGGWEGRVATWEGDELAYQDAELSKHATGELVIEFSDGTIETLSASGGPIDTGNGDAPQDGNVAAIDFVQEDCDETYEAYATGSYSVVGHNIQKSYDEVVTRTTRKWNWAYGTPAQKICQYRITLLPWKPEEQPGTESDAYHNGIYVTINGRPVESHTYEKGQALAIGFPGDIVVGTLFGDIEPWRAGGQVHVDVGPLGITITLKELELKSVHGDREYILNGVLEGI